MNTLKSLYQGEIAPFDHDFQGRSEYHHLMEQIIQNEKIIIAALTEEQQKSFDAFQDDVSKLDSMMELEAFIKGFTLAARLMIEVLSPEKDLLTNT